MNRMSLALRLIRVVLAAEGVVMSWRTLRSTRSLEIGREHGDQSVKDAVALTPQSRLFGVPNGLAAGGYLGFMLALAASGLPERNRSARALSLILAWLSLGVSVYLVAQLLFVLKRNCPLCLRAHSLNLALTLAVTARAATEKP